MRQGYTLLAIEALESFSYSGCRIRKSKTHLTYLLGKEIETKGIGQNNVEK